MLEFTHPFYSPQAPLKLLIAAPAAVSSWMTSMPRSRCFGLTMTSASISFFSTTLLMASKLAQMLFVLKILQDQSLPQGLFTSKLPIPAYNSIPELADRLELIGKLLRNLLKSSSISNMSVSEVLSLSKKFTHLSNLEQHQVILVLYQCPLNFFVRMELLNFEISLPPLTSALVLSVTSMTNSGLFGSVLKRIDQSFRIHASP